MTPDLVAELLRQLMKEAMILSAPILIAAVVLGFLLTPFPDVDQPSGAVADLGSETRRCGGDSAGRHAVVPRSTGGLHAVPHVRLTPVHRLKLRNVS